MLMTRFLMPMLFAFGQVANISALVIMRRQWKKIKKHIVSHALVHLAISDIIYLLVLGVMSLEQLLQHVISPYLCKPKFFLDVLSQHVSAWLIVMMSYERYQAMNQPYTYSSTYHSNNTIALLIVWLSGFIISAPMAIFTSATEDSYPDLSEHGIILKNITVLHCGSTWDPTWKSFYFSFLAVMECFIPVGLMVFFYVGVFKNFVRQVRNPRSALCHINQHRLSFVLGLIVMSFIVSYAPFYSIQMINEFHFLKDHQVPVIYMTVVFQILTYVNSCLNPILYGGCTKKFMLIRDLADMTIGNNPPAPAYGGNANQESKAPYVPSTTCELTNKIDCTIT
ncbi:somatostatin receptor type 4-like [Symsagittifera roscoffensis]|uniref:somatostatin receptor type 4-like n=1 Tax=Symsagittifera roscoffensis TaxID=84072 RepID=UPI00307B1301